MSTATVTSKGQVTIPREVRNRFGIRPGDKIEFVEADGELRVRKLMTGSPFDRWVGYLSHLAGQDPDALVDEMRGHDHRD